MDKLIELLNEYEKEVKKSEIVWSIDNDWDICRQTYEWVDYNEYTEYMNTNNLISKSFWFIKWLVENDKIDESKIFCDQWLYYSLLCKLAISDTPIDDLISYLR